MGLMHHERLPLESNSLKGGFLQDPDQDLGHLKINLTPNCFSSNLISVQSVNDLDPDQTVTGVRSYDDVIV